MQTGFHRHSDARQLMLKQTGHNPNRIYSSAGLQTGLHSAARKLMLKQTVQTGLHSVTVLPGS